jgi:hypothetical protein
MIIGHDRSFGSFSNGTSGSWCFRGRPVVLPFVPPITGGTRRRELISSQTTRSVHRAQDEATPRDRCGSVHIGAALQILQLA